MRFIIKSVLLLISLHVLVFVAFTANAEGFPEDKLTKGLMIGANASLILDWAQTRDISNNPNFTEGGFAENFIGKNPTTKEVNQYFIASIISTNLIGYYLPEKYKKFWYGGVLVFQVDVVTKNKSLGVKFKF